MTAYLPNYLRMHRKRSGLVQSEVAALVGVASGVRVSRHELYRRTPSLKTALAYARLYGVPVHELFAGLAEEVDTLLANHAQQLIAEDLPKDRKDHILDLLDAERMLHAPRTYPPRSPGSPRHEDTRH